MKESQNMWVSYEDAECRAVYQKWIHGTIRGLMAGSCTIGMIKQRTHKIWEEYLTYEDLTLAILPEPKL